ncbi:hypothetical protein HYFRA_00014024 [Hymenoscyphus fraxineus]|uniref:Guanine nucleotide-exchange factor SEC12 n=1 Tax=Hymenoscyphus fraxineus TaxID=746836 RepID=A0A9N9L9K8_9HELO|nr:hypothetical protein HYFRA_00014024 [Hymenoscyphus fraxineus]
MAPLIPSAKSTLSYPLYACDFDPLDSTRLVVGGGGGAGRSGVGNKITLLNTTNPSAIDESGEIELSKQEDNVTSLAIGQRQGAATTVLAGINSSPKEVAEGTNLHFRVFTIEPTAKGKGKTKGKGKVTEKPERSLPNKITEKSRSSLFKVVDADCYQRLLRLSKPQPGQPQLGAVATGLTKDTEIVLFDTSTTNPPKSRGGIRGGREAADIDFLQTGDKEYLLAYCDIHDVFVKKISADTDDEEPKSVYETPASRSIEKVTVPQFRSLRWLTKEFILMLTNIASNGGAVLQILRLPPSGKGQCRIARSLRLPSRISKASGLAVANLTPPLSPSDPQDYTQFIIAVAAQDNSISLFKTDLSVEMGVSMISQMKPFRTFKDDHPHQITGLTFSNFVPPKHPITAKTPPQHLKLASIGVSGTVVVHTLPLFPVPLSMKRGQSKTPRYVVALPSSAAAMGISLILVTLGILLGAVFVQGVLEIRGGISNSINARDYVPLRLQEIIGRPFAFPEGYNAVPSSTVSPKPGKIAHKPDMPTEPSDSSLPGSNTLLPELLSSLKSEADPTGSPKYFIQDHPASPEGFKAHIHDEELHSGSSWEEMTHEQKEKWLAKLKKAGYWAEDMGETILKGVVFGTLGGMVGEAVGG